MITFTVGAFMHSGVAFFSMPFLYLCSLIEDSHIIQTMAIQGMTDFVKWLLTHAEACNGIYFLEFTLSFAIWGSSSIKTKKPARPGEGNGNLFQYSCLENSMDRATWQVIAHGVTELDMTELTLYSKAC